VFRMIQDNLGSARNTNVGVRATPVSMKAGA
jgi:hypothetical protein